MILKKPVKNAKTHQNIVGIIGGGNVGKELLQIFSTMNSIDVKYVADINAEAPAIKMAKKQGIKTTSQIIDVVNDPEIDLLIEVTGVDKVLTIVKENMTEDTGLISGEAAYLVYNIVKDYKMFQQQLLQKEIKHLNEVYTEIQNDSQNITNLLAEINSVTKKLNILAINASIEAAHAGEEGKGFSVVAKEVKKLSEKSSHLVGDINSVNDDVIGLNNRIMEIISEIKEEQG